MLDIAKLKSKELKYVRFDIGVDSLSGESTYRLGRYKDSDTRAYYDHKQNAIIVINRKPNRLMVIPMSQVVCFEFKTLDDKLVEKAFDEAEYQKSTKSKN